MSFCQVTRKAYSEDYTEGNMKYENMIYLSSTLPARYQITILSLLSILSINVSKGKKETVLKSSLEFSINQVLLKVLPIEENQIPSEM